MIMLCFSLVFYGCDGSSSSSTSTTVSGVVMAGPVNGAKIKVKSVLGNYSATSAPTDSSGAFTIAIPNSELANDLIFEATGGLYDDEADQTAAGENVPFTKFTAHIVKNTLKNGVNVTIDPSSTIVQKLVASGKDISAVKTSFGNAFGFTPDTAIKPTFANFSTMPSDIDDKERIASLQVAAFSQLTKDLGLPADKQCDLIQALADDLADGVLNGRNDTNPAITVPGTAVALPAVIGSKFATSLESCLTAKIARPAWTSAYKFEYLPVTMATTGKSTFKIKLTNRLDGTPAIGKTVTVRPYMYMSTKSHTTPMGDITDNGDGTYTCTAYYVMSSSMGGVPMGTWELKVSVGTEAAYFYPKVGMPMGSTALAKLLGISDAILGLAGKEPRTYFMFNDGLTAEAGSTYSFKLFLATKENMTKLTFPAVTVGSSLFDETRTAWTVNSVRVVASTDNSFPEASTVTVSAIDGNGRVTVAGLTGLTAGVAGKVYVKLFVNDVQKTTDGLAVGAANGYQTFNVTPAP